MRIDNLVDMCIIKDRVFVRVCVYFAVSYININKLDFVIKKNRSLFLFIQ